MQIRKDPLLISKFLKLYNRKNFLHYAALLIHHQTSFLKDFLKAHLCLRNLMNEF